MGLDQSFYRDKQNEKEVLYFRKFWDLQEAIGHVLNEAVENGKTYRLQPEDLILVREYIAQNPGDYWAFDSDYFEAEDLPENFFYVLGVLTYFIETKQPLYYNGDW